MLSMKEDRHRQTQTVRRKRESLGGRPMHGRATGRRGWAVARSALVDVAALSRRRRRVGPVTLKRDGYASGARRLRVWCTTATHLVHDGYASGAQRLRIWCTTATRLVHDGYASGARLLRVWCTPATHLVRDGYASAFTTSTESEVHDHTNVPGGDAGAVV